MWNWPVCHFFFGCGLLKRYAIETVQRVLCEISNHLKMLQEKSISYCSIISCWCQFCCTGLVLKHHVHIRHGAKCLLNISFRLVEFIWPACKRQRSSAPKCQLCKMSSFQHWQTMLFFESHRKFIFWSNSQDLMSIPCSLFICITSKTHSKKKKLELIILYLLTI